MPKTLLYASRAEPRELKLTAAVRGTDPAGWTLRDLAGPLAWKPWPAHDHVLAWFAQIPLRGLEPDRAYTLSLVDPAGATRAQCTARTLPLQLAPNVPLRVLLASCFSRADDAGVGAALLRIPPASRPHFRILCGDQVYLDGSWPLRLLPHSKPELAEALLKEYWRSFGQTPMGFGDFLSAGSNFFLSDDHEFFNNSPFPSSVSVNVVTEHGAKGWRELATGLYRSFQGDYQGFFSADVAPLSFAFLDTRIDRDAELDALCGREDVEALASWATRLTGPGVLVLGQPLFGSAADDPRSRFGDASIQNYRQLGDIVRAIAESAHTIVVLTGDVHFGRVSICEPSTGGRLLEVISSPLAQITFAKGQWKSPPTQLAGAHGTRFAGAECKAVPGWQDEKDHFVMLEFVRTGGSVRMKMSRWRIPGRDAPLAPELPPLPL